jgi:hypothetical protein
MRCSGTDVQQDYRAVGFEGEPPPPPEQIGPRHFPAEAEEYFDEVASLRYPFQLAYSSEDYLAQPALSTRCPAPSARGTARTDSRRKQANTQYRPQIVPSDRLR